MREFICLQDNERQEMANKALALARNHTWAKMAKAYTDLYRKVG
jgi:glycosyltransferase involved in cell wall biosynthesis